MAYRFERVGELLFVAVVITVIHQGPYNSGCFLVSAVGADQCGQIIIGNSNADSEATPNAAGYERNSFYLDKTNPAVCNGTITSWRVCYYRPTTDESSRRRKRSGVPQYRARFAVYRPIDVMIQPSYTMVSGIFRATSRLQSR